MKAFRFHTQPTSNVEVGKFYPNELNITGVSDWRRQDLRSVRELASDGRLKPLVIREFPLESAREAHKSVEMGGQFGKLLLLPQYESIVL